MQNECYCELHKNEDFNRLLTKVLIHKTNVRHQNGNKSE